MKIRRSMAVLAAITFAALTLASFGSASAESEGHNQRIIVLETSTADSAVPIVIATGPIHARGTDVVVNGTKDNFVFANGSLIVIHKVRHSKDTFDPVTCYGSHSESGVYHVARGTGVYKGAHGHGTYTVKASFVGCSQTQPPDLSSLRIDASGPLWL
jgi:hypothetical protein